MAMHDLGRKTESDAAIEELLEYAGEEWSHGLAEIHAWRGDFDEAFRYLELTFVQDFGQFDVPPVNPFFNSLHDDPRWIPFLEKIGRSPRQLSEIKFNPQLPMSIAVE